jgi:hypothetical protein
LEGKHRIGNFAGKMKKKYQEVFEMNKMKNAFFMCLIPLMLAMIAAAIAGCGNRAGMTSPTGSSDTATVTMTRTPLSSVTATSTKTVTKTATPTIISSAIDTATKTATPTGVSSSTVTVTVTETATEMDTDTETSTATSTATQTTTPTTISTAIATVTGGTSQAAVVLGTAATFAILSDQAITDIPTSAITGDVGIYPGLRSSITGLTIPEVNGTIYAADDADPVPAMLIQAKTDALNAYLDATAGSRGTPTSISGDLNGLTLAPGLYESSSTIEISPGGILYLDGQGDANAVFVIRSANSITTESTSAVVLEGSAQAKNIFWAAGSAITLGTYSTMKGTLIAGTSISLLTGARLDGRALIQGAAAGQVSLDQNIIVLP